jgi:hypothetical protein
MFKTKTLLFVIFLFSLNGFSQDQDMIKNARPGLSTLILNTLDKTNFKLGYNDRFGKSQAYDYNLITPLSSYYGGKDQDGNRVRGKKMLYVDPTPFSKITAEYKNITEQNYDIQKELKSVKLVTELLSQKDASTAVTIKQYLETNKYGHKIISYFLNLIEIDGKENNSNTGSRKASWNLDTLHARALNNSLQSERESSELAKLGLNTIKQYYNVLISNNHVITYMPFYYSSSTDGDNVTTRYGIHGATFRLIFGQKEIDALLKMQDSEENINLDLFEEYPFKFEVLYSNSTISLIPTNIYAQAASKKADYNHISTGLFCVYVDAIENIESLRTYRQIEKTRPVRAEIGKKDDIYANQLFEVNEFEDDGTGTRIQKRVGYIRAKKPAVVGGDQTKFYRTGGLRKFYPNQFITQVSRRNDAYWNIGLPTAFNYSSSEANSIRLGMGAYSRKVPTLKWNYNLDLFYNHRAKIQLGDEYLYWRSFLIRPGYTWGKSFHLSNLEITANLGISLPVYISTGILDEEGNNLTNISNPQDSLLMEWAIPGDFFNLSLNLDMSVRANYYLTQFFSLYFEVGTYYPIVYYLDVKFSDDYDYNGYGIKENVVRPPELNYGFRVGVNIFWKNNLN